MTAAICISFIPKTVNDALQLIEEAEKYDPNFIEVRLDRIKETKRLCEIAASAKTPLIATNRSTSCGGFFQGKEEERLKILFEAANSGFKYVDIEVEATNLRKIVNSLRQIGVKPIISFHDFEETPHIGKLKTVFKTQIENEAEICKIVTTAKTMEDNLTLMKFLSQVSKKAKVVCFAMGPLGTISRFLSPLFGGFFTIASLKKGEETAPGQLTIQELKTAYKALGVE
ncbi:type I 3-dehydroquinate dehydratase [Candidatus Bathyarchaeota archaeon]|nr:type I 3-dehydroquinate dehydratase [Candidatus Bathyarchaeota archaeon]